MVSDCLLVASCCHCCFYSFSASVVLLLGLLPPFCTRLEGLEGRAAFLSNPKCGDKGETGCWAPGGWLASCWHPSALPPPARPMVHPQPHGVAPCLFAGALGPAGPAGPAGSRTAHLGPGAILGHLADSPTLFEEFTWSSWELLEEQLASRIGIHFPCRAGQ